MRGTDLPSSMASSMASSLAFSVQALGRLPAGLVRECEEAAEFARRFNREVVNPVCLELDRRIEADSSVMPDEIVAEMGRRGLLTLWIPKIFGGGGFSPFSMMAFNEELASGCLGVSNLIGAHYFAYGLASATSNMSALKILSEACLAGEKSGRPCLLSAAITEPAAGTDLEDVDLIDRAKVQTTVRRTEKGLRLQGAKVFISNAAMCRWLVVSAYGDLKKPGAEPWIVLVPREHPGVRIGRVEQKMGQHACPASPVFFDDCEIKPEWVCFSPDQFKSLAEARRYADLLIQDVLALSRMNVGAYGAGAAIASVNAVRDAVEKAKVPQPEWFHAVLGEMLANYQVARATTWDAGCAAALVGANRALFEKSVYGMNRSAPPGFWKAVAKLLNLRSLTARLRRARLAHADPETIDRLSALGAAAKVSGSTAAVKNAQLALDLSGVFSHEPRFVAEVSKILRDSKLLQIYEGTNLLNLLEVSRTFQSGARPFQEGASP